LLRAGAQFSCSYVAAAKEADGVVAEIRKAGGRAMPSQRTSPPRTDPASLPKQARSIIGDRLDILVANAGISKAASIEEITVEDFDKLFAVNVRSAVFPGGRQLLPVLGDGSSVILVSSSRGARRRRHPVGSTRPRRARSDTCGEVLRGSSRAAGHPR